MIDKVIKKWKKFPYILKPITNITWRHAGRALLNKIKRKFRITKHQEIAFIFKVLFSSYFFMFIHCVIYFKYLVRNSRNLYTRTMKACMTVVRECFEEKENNINWTLQQQNVLWGELQSTPTFVFSSTVSSYWCRIILAFYYYYYYYYYL